MVGKLNNYKYRIRYHLTDVDLFAEAHRFGHCSSEGGQQVSFFVLSL